MKKSKNWFSWTILIILTILFGWVGAWIYLIKKGNELNNA